MISVVVGMSGGDRWRGEVDIGRFMKVTVRLSSVFKGYS
jgi:hypothetical protein